TIPLLSLGGGGGGDVKVSPMPAFRDRSAQALGALVQVLPPFSRHSRTKVGAWLLPRALTGQAHLRADHLSGVGSLPNGSASRLASEHRRVDSLPDVHGLGESAAVQPCEAIPHFESCVFDGDGEAVPGARPTECGDVTAWLEYPVARFGPFQ